MKDKLFFFIICIFFFACKSEPKKQLIEIVTGTPIPLKYASGFSAKDYGTYKIIEITQPWPNANQHYRFALLKPNYDTDIWSHKKTRFDDVIELPIKKIVVTSTTHIPALELLNIEETLIGFPGTDFISSKKIRKRIDAGFIKELGKNESLNTEILLGQDPDLVVGFGIDGSNRAFKTLKNSGIPVIYNGDWTESSPLAKAEWIKFFGILFNKEKTADSIFNTIEKNYLAAKKVAKKADTKPTVLSGAMHSDVWYLPNGKSTEAQLLNDANVNYLWSNSEGSGSLKLNFESVFEKAKDADIWLSPSNYSSLQKLKNANSHHTMFKAFNNKTIYSFTNTTGNTGGVMYYELGYARPDWVLKDIIKICHPELLKDYKPFFFKQLL
ncbi:ABC transporter substrate-binding protein [Seonamhaeicola sediminis]|uniref:ABC transporter substrate-binding protein n=1 Tax=Seonamhaeicola sediminis TaxID=2528206 RepID=A0A562YCQ8_9FLAO|nr:ABC transporter substrate-binding protein [Seonamhaeicola sediminis]TWO31867.1 ABC transporter substrate-binding protein [Seonamhaeicola sediminis]